MLTRRKVLALGAGAIVAGTTSYFFLRRSDHPVLNILGWTGYEERDFLEPFEKLHGASIRVRTYANADQMVSILLANPDEFDLVVVDPEYLQLLVSKSVIDPVDYSTLDLNGYFTYFQNHPLTRINGKQYAVPIRFGVNALVFNKEEFDERQLSSYETLFSQAARGKVGIWDWYLPNMGVISRSLGNSKPYDLSAEQFDTLKQQLSRLRPNVGSIYASLPDLVAALAARRIAIAPGVGEFVAAAAANRGARVGWTVPKEGGIMWVETMAVCSHSSRKPLAAKFLSWVTTPEAQALLAQRRAYNSNTPNRLAYPLLSSEQRQYLNAETAQETERLIGRLSVRTLPANQTPQEWQEVWRGFKGGV